MRHHERSNPTNTYAKKQALFVLLLIPVAITMTGCSTDLQSDLTQASAALTSLGNLSTAVGKSTQQIGTDQVVVTGGAVEEDATDAAGGQIAVVPFDGAMGTVGQSGSTSQSTTVSIQDPDAAPSSGGVTFDPSQLDASVDGWTAAEQAWWDNDAPNAGVEEVYIGGSNAGVTEGSLNIPVSGSND